jgi:hypothetical protein
MQVRTLLWVLPLLIAGDLLSVEPPREGLLPALKKGVAVLRGRVVSTQETAREKWGTRAEMRLEILDCLKGVSSCPSSLTLRYVAQSLDERVFGIDFCIGEEVFLVLRRPIESLQPYEFSSRVGPDCDFAYRGEKLPRLDEPPVTRLLQSVYGGRAEHVLSTDLDSALARPQGTAGQTRR